VQAIFQLLARIMPFDLKILLIKHFDKNTDVVISSEEKMFVRVGKLFIKFITDVLEIGLGIFF
jgi:hypothetical protein